MNETMLGKLYFVFVLILLAVGSNGQGNRKKVVCFYDSMGNFRDGYAKFENSFLTDALQYCTHLIYGDAGINYDNFKLIPLNQDFDVTRNNYRQITNLKKSYPNLKVLLSVGGGRDVESKKKYIDLLEDSDDRAVFVESAVPFLKTYGFDGLDLAWQFPTNKPKKVRSAIGNVWSSVKHTFVDPSPVDEKADQHKQQFAAFIREFKEAFADDGLQLTISVLPNVNSTLFYDVRTIIPNLDFVNLLAFDYYTSQRNPKEADYPAPLHEIIDRKYDENGNSLIQYWLQNGAPSNKLILGIPTYGRTWKMTRDSGTSGVPPIAEVKGGGQAGPYTKEEGLLSYPEICAKLNNRNNIGANTYKQIKDATGKQAGGWHLIDVSKRYGTYAFRLPNESGDGGIWIGYEDPETVGNKAAFSRSKSLGGIAMVDLTLDDFRGLCGGEKYPLLRAASSRL